MSRRGSHFQRLHALTTACWLALAGCGISPQPEPPSGMNFDKVKGDAVLLWNAPWSIVGNPGAVASPGATLRAFNLEDDVGPFVDTVVKADGSFSLSLDAMKDGNEVRFQILEGTVRSAPMDVVFARPSTPPSPALRPLSDCLKLTPSLELVVGSAEGVVVRNECKEDIEFLAPRLRRPTAGVVIDAGASAAFVLVPGAQQTVRVDIEPGTASFDEILFVETSRPQRDRRPITLHFENH